MSVILLYIIADNTVFSCSVSTVRLYSHIYMTEDYNSVKPISPRQYKYCS